MSNLSCDMQKYTQPPKSLPGLPSIKHINNAITHVYELSQEPFTQMPIRSNALMF